MNIERLRKIIAYSEKNSEEINSMVKRFASFAGVEYDGDLLNILQIVRSSFQKKGYFIFEIPFADDEIGALCYRDDCFGYVVVNTSLPRVNVNFALAHEIYHVFFGENESISKVEFADDHYYEHEEEYAANLFAGMLLMPEVSFRRMYAKFRSESCNSVPDTIIQLVAYYQVPYMAALIRCLELDLINKSLVTDQIFNISRNQIKQRLTELWLDESIMDSSKRDDYSHIEEIVRKLGKEYIDKNYINEATLKKVIKNMRELYANVKGA